MTGLASFNLLRDAWIPVLDNSGGIAEGSIMDVLTNAHNLAGISDPSPVVELGLYRFLIAFVMDAFSVDDFDAIESLLDRGAFAPETFHMYVEETGLSKFDLFDCTTPFYQADEEAVEKLEVVSVAALMRHLPAGSFATHFHHVKQEDQAWSPAVCARALVSIPAFMTAGGRGYSPSVNGNPPWYVLVLGENLFSTIVLNCCGLDIPGLRGSDPPAWRSAKRIVPGERRRCNSLLEGLTWQPRCIRLIPSEGGTCTYTGRESPMLVRNMSFGPGLMFDGEWTDPQVAYRITENGATPLRAQGDKEIWRDVGPLMLLREHDYEGGKGKQKVRFARPAVVNQFLRLRDERVISATESLSVQVYGIRTDGKMKLYEWAREKLSLQAEIARRPIAAATVQSNIESAELVAYYLDDAIKRICPEEGKRNRNAFRTLQWRAQRRYWADLYPVFERDFLSVLAMGDVEDADFIDSMRYRWTMSAIRQATEVFNWIASPLEMDPDSMERVAKARNYLNRKAAYSLKWLSRTTQKKTAGGDQS